MVQYPCLLYYEYNSEDAFNDRNMKRKGVDAPQLEKRPKIGDKERVGGKVRRPEAGRAHERDHHHRQQQQQQQQQQGGEDAEVEGAGAVAGDEIGGADASASSAGRIENTLSYIRLLARQPTLLAGDNIETGDLRNVVLLLSRALYKGPKLGVKAKKKSKAAVCSPALFLGGVPKVALGPRAIVGGPSQKHTFGCFESYLDVVAKCYYDDPVATAAPHSEEERADLFLQRKTVLGKLSNLWRRRSPIDTWAPLEIALFESAICVHGKGKYAGNF